MTWYKKDSECQCEKPEGVCICDGQVDEVKGGPEPPTHVATSDESSTSRTASVHSLQTTTVGSQDMLYIPPNDVLRALAGFLKQFNAKTKLYASLYHPRCTIYQTRHQLNFPLFIREKLSEEERVKTTLSKLRLPSVEEMRDYWSRFLPLVQHFDSNGFWESLLDAFTDYHVLLKRKD